MPKLKFLALLAALLLSSCASQELNRNNLHRTDPIYVGVVTRVIDGDTVIIKTNGESLKIRLSEIDAPENGQPYGREARDALSQMVLGKEVRVKEVGHDRYERAIGRIYVNETDISRALVEKGDAWVYREYSKDKMLLPLEEAAKKSKTGLWKNSNPTPPWVWRKTH